MFYQSGYSRVVENGEKIKQNEKKRRNDKTGKKGAQTDYLFCVININLFKRIQDIV